MIIETEQHDLATPTGPMRTVIFRPVAKGRYPGILFFSEIFQLTGPIRRMAAFLAGNGYLVAVPEIFHELNPIGTVLAYDQQGADKGNADKITKTIESYDSDARLTIAMLRQHPACSGKLLTMGICIGGHLALRAAFNPEIRAAACFYATDVHTRSLGAGRCDDSLDRIDEVRGELMMVWGRQDPHIPQEGRTAIYSRLAASKVNFTWHELNGAHAFLRDEGPRYDADNSLLSQQLVRALFHRATCGVGDEE